MVFGCISKNFPENIFWCLEKKKENTNSEKHKPQPRSRHPTTAIRDHDRRIFIWDLAIFLDGSSSWIFLLDLSAYIRHVAISDLPLSPLIAISIRRDLVKARSRSTARSRRHEIAINGTISRRRDRDQWRYLATVRSCSSLLLSCTRALSLSLSLIFWKCFEGKIEV